MKNNTKTLAILNLVAYLAMIAVNALANALPINGKNTGEISSLYPNLFVPAGITFSIWGVIYIVLLLFVIYQIRMAFSGTLKEQAFISKIGILFLVSSIANLGWILAWHYLQVGLSFFIMLFLLASLILIYLKLGIGRTSPTSSERFLVYLPFSVYLGWITVATIANLTALLVHLDWSGWGISSPVWASLLIAIGTLIGIRMLTNRSDIFYALVLIWALVGIVIKRSSALSPEPIVSNSAGIGAMVLSLLIVWKLFRSKPSLD